MFALTCDPTCNDRPQSASRERHSSCSRASCPCLFRARNGSALRPDCCGAIHIQHTPKKKKKKEKTPIQRHETHTQEARAALAHTARHSRESRFFVQFLAVVLVIPVRARTKPASNEQTIFFRGQHKKRKTQGNGAPERVRTRCCIRQSCCSCSVSPR